MKEIIGDAVKQFTTMEDKDNMYFCYAGDSTFMNAVIVALENINGDDFDSQVEFLSWIFPKNTRM